jgi:DNA-binding transcriptional ArsR family regulator
MSEIDIEQLEIVAARLKSIAHPIRIAVISLLQEKGKLCVTDIHNILEIGQAVASHHLYILKTNGILSCKREGKQMQYTLKSNNLNKILECINKCSSDL